MKLYEDTRFPGINIPLAEHVMADLEAHPEYVSNILKAVVSVLSESQQDRIAEALNLKEVQPDA